MVADAFGRRYASDHPTPPESVLELLHDMEEFER